MRSLLLPFSTVVVVVTPPYRSMLRAEQQNRRFDRSSGRLKTHLVRRSTIERGKSMNIPPSQLRHSPTVSQPKGFSPSSVIQLGLLSAVFSLSGVLAFLPLTPHQRHPRKLTTTPQSVIAFPTPESDILDAAEDCSSQEFQGPFPPLRRPLRLRPESSPARGLYLFEQVSQLTLGHVVEEAKIYGGA